MGVVKDKINKIKSPFIRKLIKPVYLLVLKTYKLLLKQTEKPAIHRIQKDYKEVVKNIQYKIQQGEPVNVAFVVVSAAMWKYDALFQKMKEDDFFNVVVFACPLKDVSHREHEEELKRIYNMCQAKGYPMLNAYDSSGKLVDLKSQFLPDITFFTNPHELTYQLYSIEHFLDSLCCYAPYSIMATNKPYLQNDTFFHQVLWRNYVETEFHQQMAQKYGRIKGVNTKAAGSAILESLSFSGTLEDPWKCQGKKRLIYAPHHTFNDLEEMNFSTIIKNGRFLLKMAKKYRDEIHIAFKPHPHLKSKLYAFHEWGEEKTNAFYAEWEGLPNCQVEEGDYISLFQYSDAMIMDSISFMTEYSFTSKPALFLLHDLDSLKLFNEYGAKLVNVLYKGISHEEIEGFILNIIDDVDIQKTERTTFISSHFNTESSSFSTNVIQDIKKALTTE